MKTKISAIIRCAVLMLSLVNQTVAVFVGVSFEESPAYVVISIAATVLSSVYAAWKNNDFTLFAKIAGRIFSALKDGKITAEEAETFLTVGEIKGDNEEEDKN